jgi:hypothetical protein
MRVRNSVKSSERISLELLNSDIIGFTQLQDSKIWIRTPNEEEGLSFIFGNKTKRSVLNDISNADIKNYTMIASNETDLFAIEISAH